MEQIFLIKCTFRWLCITKLHMWGHANPMALLYIHLLLIEKKYEATVSTVFALAFQLTWRSCSRGWTWGWSTPTKTWVSLRGLKFFQKVSSRSVRKGSFFSTTTVESVVFSAAKSFTTQTFCSFAFSIQPNYCTNPQILGWWDFSWKSN